MSKLCAEIVELLFDILNTLRYKPSAVWFAFQFLQKAFQIDDLLTNIGGNEFVFCGGQETPSQCLFIVRGLKIFAYNDSVKPT
jgi:hypothetical protein